jgi:hypothetical protein
LTIGGGNDFVAPLAELVGEGGDDEGLVVGDEDPAWCGGDGRAVGLHNIGMIDILGWGV